MCVIFVVDEDSKRPNNSMIEKAFSKNDDGAGLAWREDGWVLWKKGITDVEEVKKMCRELPVPYVAHFRIVSMNGGGIDPRLCHPFEISEDTTLALEGRTKNHVLFHNGDWKGWDDAALRASITNPRGVQVPIGRWSDTRAMAWLCSIYGLGFMELLPSQKGVAFGPNDEDIHFYNGSNWSLVNEIWCSNDYFVTYVPAYSYPATSSMAMCEWGNCTIKEKLDTDGRCHVHPKWNYPDRQSGPLYVTTTPASGAAGVTQTPTPFRQQEAAARPARPLITMEEVERLRTEQKLSKNMYKQIKKCLLMMDGSSEKDTSWAKSKLELATKVLFSTGRLG
jgi:hypothetical protein